MKEKTLIVGVIGPDKFAKRLGLEPEFGKVLHDQIIAVLGLIGKEESPDSFKAEYRIGVYLDSNNEGAAYYALNEAAFNVFIAHFGHRFFDHLKAYAKKQRNEGTNVLLSLNRGEISMDDFNKSL